VDDTLLMNTPTTQEANNLKTILTDFVEASGTSLNLDNSQLFFFNAPMAIQTHIYMLLGIPKSSLPSNCLGIPLTGETIHIISWDSLLLSISNHLNNWIFFSLNLAARLVLLKYVLQALPTYLFTTLTTP
jgi:hypothetical protein